MNRNTWIPLAVAAITAAVVLPVALTASSSNRKNVDTATQSVGVSTAPITITSATATAFTPDPSDAAAASMSAESAYEQYEGGHGIPPNVTAQYGTLTQPAGNPAVDGADTSYVVRDLPVWAYSSQGTCDRGYGFVPDPTPTPDVCTSWDFLNAATGEQVMSTQQS
jgi:hypothetical protein